MNSIRTKKLKAKIIKMDNQFGQFLICPKTYKLDQIVEITECYSISNKKTWWEHNLVRSISYVGWASIGSSGHTTIYDRDVLERYFKIVN